MMKPICNIILIFFFLIHPAWGEEPAKPQLDELTRAYQREILFLSTYKKELKSKIASVKESLGGKVQQGDNELKSMETQWLTMQTDNEVLMQKLQAIEVDYENKQENRNLLQTTLKQAQWEQTGSAQNAVKEGVSLLEQIKEVYGLAVGRLAQANEVKSHEGPFYLKNGEEQKGKLIELGSVARFASVDGRVAALYPSGAGTFRVWKWLGEEAQSLNQGQIPTTLQFFLFDNPDKEFMAQKEKTLMDVMNAGGLIGWIIVVMGLFAFLISVIRFLLLNQASTQKSAVLESALLYVRKGDVEKAQHLLLRENSAVARVLNKTLSFLQTEPQKVEDAIMEAILKESQSIDRFGVVILVIASVAPLMGLLGTVTGMISTFDIITLYGTGNPKLLSGGISEALVTTMFGLIVAIPSLLVGQFLSSKTEGIKSDMEKWALAACNAYKNQKGSA
jgi:biopolymer transport protein ExbB